MNNIIAKYCTIFLILLLISCKTEQVEQEKTVEHIVKTYQEKDSTAKLVSHRGYDNNQLAGFYAAIEDGFTRVETDVRLRNGQAVLLHDNVDCTNCPQLIELLELAQSKGITLFIEFKEFKAIDISLELLSKYNVEVVLTSFEPAHLKYLNASSNYSLGLITNESFDLENSPWVDYLLIQYMYIDKCPALIECVAWGISNKSQLNEIKYKADYAVIDRF